MTAATTVTPIHRLLPIIDFAGPERDIPVAACTDDQLNILTLHLGELRPCKSCGRSCMWSWCSSECFYDEDGGDRD